MKVKEKSKSQQMVSARVARQIELLKKYYDVDAENRVIYLELRYETVSEVLANDISIKEHPQFSRDILERVNQIMDTFPDDFDVDLKLKFDDYCGYKPEILMAAFKDNLEMFHYSCQTEKKNVFIISSILIIVAVTLMSLRLFCINGKLIPDGGILQEMIDISGWAFLWEAVSMLFISQNDKIELSRRVVSHLLKISFLDEDDKVLQIVTKDELTSKWIFETKRQKNGRMLLLISGAACVAFGVIRFFDGLGNMLTILNNEDGVDLVTTYSQLGNNIVLCLVFTLAGFGALNMFREKGKLQHFVPVFAWFMFVIDVSTIVLSIITLIISKSTDTQNIAKVVISDLGSTIITILYFIGYIITKKNKRVSLSTLK